MIGRVIEQHRSSIIVMAEQGQVTLTLAPNSERVCVGDWIWFNVSLRAYRSLAINRKPSPFIAVSNHTDVIMQ